LVLVAIVSILLAAPATAHGIKSKASANAKIKASFDILEARAEAKGNLVTFFMTTRGKAGADRPKATGKFAGSSVYAYVWPTKVDPEAAGFEKGSGILA